MKAIDYLVINTSAGYRTAYLNQCFVGFTCKSKYFRENEETQYANIKYLNQYDKYRSLKILKNVDSDIKTNAHI